MSTYYGIYRGTVVDNVDPMQMGRLTLACPDVGDASSSAWAMPCVPASCSAIGAVVVPTVGSSVWVQFEAGDPDRPVWIGSLPGASGGVALTSSTGATITVNDTGISIENGKGASLVLTGPNVTIVLATQTRVTAT